MGAAPTGVLPTRATPLGVLLKGYGFQTSTRKYIIPLTMDKELTRAELRAQRRRAVVPPQVVTVAEETQKNFRPKGLADVDTIERIRQQKLKEALGDN